MLNLRKLAAEREKASEDKADLFDFYNDNWDKLVAEVERLREPTGEKDPEEVCDECNRTIPFNADTIRDGDGSIANKHHDESCSLYDSDEE
jgi:hypothetical protein